MKKSVSIILLLSLMLGLSGCLQIVSVQTIQDNDVSFSVKVGMSPQMIEEIMGESISKQEIVDTLSSEFENIDNYFQVQAAEWKSGKWDYVGIQMDYTLTGIIQAMIDEAAIDLHEMFEQIGGMGWTFNPVTKQVHWDFEYVPKEDMQGDSIPDTPPMIMFLTLDLPEQTVTKTTGTFVGNGKVSYEFDMSMNMTLSTTWQLSDSFALENSGALAVMHLMNTQKDTPENVILLALQWLQLQNVSQQYIDELKTDYGINMTIPTQPKEDAPLLAGTDPLEKYADSDKVAPETVRAIKWMVSNRVLVGDGTNLMPKKIVTRAEAAKMLRSSLAVCKKLTMNVKNAELADVKVTDWFYNDVMWAWYCGITNGTGVDSSGKPMYSPHKNLTYEELGLMLDNAASILKLESPANTRLVPYGGFSNWAVRAAPWVPNNKKPTGEATREDFALMIMVLVDLIQ